MIELDLKPRGQQSKVIINGQDIADQVISATVHMECASDAVPIVTLTIVGTMNIKTEGAEVILMPALEQSDREERFLEGDPVASDDCCGQGCCAATES